MKRLQKYFTLKHLLIFGLPIVTPAALIALVWNTPRIASLLQANPFGPVLDSVILLIALTYLTLMFYASLLSGAFGGWLFEQIFTATLLAMVQMQRLSTSAWYLGLGFLCLIAPAIRYISADLLLSRWFEKRHLAYPLAKIPSRSTLPYELFPVSCILLN